MGKSAPARTPAEAADAVKQEARFGAAFLRVHGRRLLLVFVGLLLPLWGFGTLVEALHGGEGFPFDRPGLELAQAMASAGFDHLFAGMSALGYLYGVVPADIALILVLAVRRRFREGLFAAAAVAGSALLNIVAKHAFSRPRPSLWESIAPETTYSFPSAHAMGSMTLVAVIVLLCWPTQWRWLTAILGAGFVIMVGLSRIYLGVHYPSDILAGWAAALVWTVGVYGLVFSRGRGPWGTHAQ
ncbi:MAG: phosphatase PAP2 family protein [Luteimonas sp.]